MKNIILLAMFCTSTAAWAAEDAPTADDSNASMEMTLDQQYLNLPIRNRGKGDEPDRKMTLTIDGKLFGEFCLRVADNNPDWWAFFDLARFQGQKLVIKLTD